VASVAQIFISHSAKDRPILDFINRAFASAKVEAKYEEIEAILEGRRTAQQIVADIARSNAVFILLGENVEKIRHTQQWVLWESGVAGAANKDIWVFEAIADHGKLSVLIPHLHHHVCFDYSDPWLVYIRAIISSYDDSHVLPAISAGVATGIATENPLAGLLAGGIAALLLAGNKQGPPAGLMIRCTGCNSIYRIHRDPAWNVMRCPVCNGWLQLQFPQSILG
jgi:hypothetical protein